MTNEIAERIARVRARLDAVGPVEWRSMRDGNQYLYGIKGQTYLPTVEAVHASRVDGLARAWNPHAVIAFMVMDAAHVSRFRDEEADLIAAAPSDLAFLLSRVDSLESALRDAQKDAERVTWLEDQTWDDLGKLATLMDDERDCDTLRKAIDVARKRWADTGEST